jgi:hypothetical protein
LDVLLGSAPAQPATLAAGGLDARFAIERRNGFVSKRLEQVDHQLQVVTVVFNNQNAAHLMLSGRRPSSCGGLRQRQSKRAAHAELAFKADVPAQQAR